MSFGNSVKRIANDFNLGLKIYKLTRAIKPACPGIVFDTSKCKDVPFLKEQLNSHLLCKYQIEKFCFNFPQVNGALNKSIIEPDNSIKIRFELPIKKSVVTALDLPPEIEKKINEPGSIIHKSAGSHIIRIRRRKMKRHKKKKYRKKHEAELFKLKLQRKKAIEATFDSSLKEVLQEINNFSAENYVKNLIEDAHWEKPVTKVKGFLAPQWVIQQYIEKEKRKKILEERIKECQE